MSVGPSGVVGVTYRGFNLLHRPLLKRFPVFIWLLFGRSLQCLISALTQAGGGGLLFRSLVPSRCGEGGALLSPLRCSGSRLLCVERALRCARFQLSAFHGSADSVVPAFCAFPGPAAQAARSLTGTLSTGALSTGSGAWALCLAVALPGDVDHPESQEVLVRNWRPACSVVGAAVLGAEPAPFPSPLPPASGGAGPVGSAACELFSGLAQTLCSANGGSVFGLVNFLSFFAVPHFKLVTHKRSLWLPSGH